LSTVAYAESLYDYQTLDIELTESSQIAIQPKQPSYYIDYLRAYLYLYPKENSHYEIGQITAIPEAKEVDGALLYVWREPRSTRLEFSLKSELSSSSNMPAIRQKVSFPAQFPAELSDYTRATAHIDSNDENIKAQASRIAEGEDDLFVVLFKLGSWVEQNVEYDLSTLTADVSQKASWVLKNRVGVCDEMTSLFIAMARSLGIPARFVTGVSYTTHPAFDRNWQPHGWAEAYIPEVGWVPFDPTFKQFGYVDATHIKLGDSLDPEQTATKFEWTGNVDIFPSKLNFDAAVGTKGKKNSPRIQLYVEPMRQELAFGSYNIIKTTVKNNLNQYVTAALFASIPSELTADKKKQHILLRPYEEDSIFWLVKVSDDLEKRYIYTLPISITTEQNFTVETSFTSKEQGVFISKPQAEAIIKEMTYDKIADQDEEQKPAQNIGLNCTITPIVLVNQTADVECTAQNKGNTITTIRLCSENTCKELDLYIADEKKAGFSFSRQKVGKFEQGVQLQAGGFTKTVYLPYEVLDSPIVEINEIELPDKVSFEDDFRLGFSVDKRSYALPKQIEVRVSGGNINEAFKLDNISYVHTFSIVSQGKYLHEGANNIVVRAKWYDREGNTFNTTVEVPITLDKLTFSEKVESLFLRFGLWLKR
ncbi:transglutaminase domain-containing protein, partial [Candidatus Woesearchaeota archaeon]|nr:transglutaminase domain-containing protein [Candidatus Woesearchaeota archaeon]